MSAFIGCLTIGLEMRLAKEGYTIVLLTFMGIAVVVAGLLCAVMYGGMPVWLFWVLTVLLFALLLCVALFFREPTRRSYVCDPDTVFSSVDGKVVVVEEVYEGEFLMRQCIQLSVFMSLTNIHANWYPVGGRIVYRNNHMGRFFVAWHPKSSEENERTTTVVDTGHELILFRQIAGLVARRIVNYAEVGGEAVQNTKFGFIKFGSRVDIFLPLGTEVLVKLGDKVRGGQTPIARLKH